MGAKRERGITKVEDVTDADFVPVTLLLERSHSGKQDRLLLVEEGKSGHAKAVGGVLRVSVEKTGSFVRLVDDDDLTAAPGRVRPEAVLHRLHDVLVQRVGAGTLTESEAEAAVEAFANRLPDDDDPTEALGPYFDTQGLRRRLGVTRQALTGRVQRNTLLAVPADDGALLYPTWQFTPDLEPLAGLSEVLSELNRVAKDGLSKALWLTTPQGALGQVSAANWLAQGRDPAAVLALAHADVERMLR
ncbi:hypothetical protein H5398_11150 [Tessaracoccus sp. MC1679]|nr:hypothetical protein [Tessaracoccus sp. MC1679]MBB1516520.1 hypothetical protein [Tessaracoccus sp. MC1679]